MSGLVLVSICMMALNIASAELPPRFFEALRAVETSGRNGPIRGDSGRALGPLQIHWAYWREASVPGRYADCARFDYSCAVVSAYLRRYGAEAMRRLDYQTLARIHNGGPDGCANPRTLRYWQKVRKFL